MKSIYINIINQRTSKYQLFPQVMQFIEIQRVGLYLAVIFTMIKDCAECYAAKEEKIRYVKDLPDQKIALYAGRQHCQKAHPYPNSPGHTDVV